MSILFVSPNAEMNQRLQLILTDQQDLEFSVLDDNLLERINLERDNIEVIVARGGTANKIRKMIEYIPVVEVAMGAFDLLEAVERAIAKSEKFGFIVSQNMIPDISIIEEVYGIKPKIYLTNDLDESDVNECLELAREEQVEVVIGGILAVKEAEKKGMAGVLIDWRDESVLDALQLACWVTDVKRSETEKVREFETILDFCEEGLIMTDASGIVTHINSTGVNMLQTTAPAIIGKCVWKFLQMKVDAKMLEKRERVEDVYQEVNGVQLLLNIYPIFINENNLGWVINMCRTAVLLNQARKLRTDDVYGDRNIYTLDDLLGSSPAIKKMRNNATLYANSNSTVLITGETGTGKEIVAHGLHQASPRKNEPFITLNCAALPDKLLQAELFGYTEGAFTGARKGGKLGLFTQAHRGTLFLDEIQSMSLNAQALVLRALQEREVMPLGSRILYPIDVRIIASSNGDLWSYVLENRFRKDLFYRLAVLKLNMPPLRERTEDIPILLEYFLLKKGRKDLLPFIYDAAFYKVVTEHSWPGNVRELRNLAERLCALNAAALTVEEIRRLLEGEHSEVVQEYDLNANITVRGDIYQIRRQLAKKALEQTDGDRKQAANLLGISEVYMRKLLKGEEEYDAL